MATETGTDVAVGGETVLDWAIGEKVELATASSVRLAEVIEHGRAVQTSLKDVEQAVSDELVSRLDKDVSWTYRVDGLKISAPSPEKGTEDFPLDALENCLMALIENGVISAEGAAGAIKRQLVLTVNVPLGVDLESILKMVERSETTFDFEDHPLPVVKAEKNVSKIAGGITKLRKIPAAAEALKGAAEKVEPPPRKVKIERE